VRGLALRNPLRTKIGSWKRIEPLGLPRGSKAHQPASFRAAEHRRRPKWTPESDVGIML
jgi:hypothetical protein